MFNINFIINQEQDKKNRHPHIGQSHAKVENVHNMSHGDTPCHDSRRESTSQAIRTQVDCIYKFYLIYKNIQKIYTTFQQYKKVWYQFIKIGMLNKVALF